MDINKAYDKLMNSIEKLGAIDWHTSNYKSRYIKFKDCRIGSIRISNHRGRRKYSYKWEFDCNKDKEGKLDTIINQVFARSRELKNYKPDQYVVWSKIKGKFIKVEDYSEYREYVLGIKNKGVI